MTILQSLNINRLSLYQYHIKNQGIADHPDVWHAWKMYIWPGYSDAIEALIDSVIFIEQISEGINISTLSHYKNKISAIEKVTGLEWDEVKERLK